MQTACRGSNTDPGIESRVETDGVTSSIFNCKEKRTIEEKHEYLKFPILADFLFMYSTQEDHYSFRNTQNGSWFIASLCKELSSRWKKQDLQTILTFVNRTMAFKYISYSPDVPERHEKKQIGSMVSSLTRLCHFNK